MKNANRKVVILKDVNSDMIEQAILVLRNSASDGESKLLREAEKIVEKYMDKKGQKVKEEKKPSTAMVLSLIAIVISVGVLAFAYFG